MTRPMSTALQAERLITYRADWSPGWLLVEGERITQLGAGQIPAELRGVPREEVSGVVAPAFVDIHAHGALGHDFVTADQDEAQEVVDYHARQGSTRMNASLASAPLGEMEAAVRRLAPLVARGVLSGIHLEARYLSEAQKGAHDASLLAPPDVGELERLVDAGRGALRMVTLAPELPGSEAAVRFLVRAGVTVALGHSAADAATARRAVSWGASVGTHLFNGMRPLHHRELGIVGALLMDDTVTVELIPDGHHLADDALDLVARCAPGRIAVVSDAMAATGCADGHYQVGASAVLVEDGVARLADGSSLAGSTSTVLAGVLRLAARPRIGLVPALRAGSATPARAVALASDLAPGHRADLVVIGSAQDAAVGHDLELVRVMRAGRWLT